MPYILANEISVEFCENILKDQFFKLQLKYYTFERGYTVNISSTTCLNLQHKPFITTITIANNMKSSKVTILDILKAAFLQILIWQWELRMIRKYGFDWGYKDPTFRTSSHQFTFLQLSI
jgi:hypothetical protein